MKNRQTPKGFTLIELLIVVAIIAILAAIAVPNFLEAQVRAKVSRAQADMRSISTALESYVVDHNRYPIGYINIRQAVATGSVTAPPFPSSNVERNPFAMHFLTTPIAYVSTTFIDPFTEGGSFLFDRVNQITAPNVPYWYDDYQPYPEYTGFPDEGFHYARFKRIYQDGYRWSISSAGPERSQMMMWLALDGEDPASAADHIVFPYDPTNGTVSEGFVGRTSKGVYKEVNQ